MQAPTPIDHRGAAAASGELPPAVAESRIANALIAALSSGGPVQAIPALVARVNAFLHRPAPVSTARHPAIAAALRTAADQGALHRWWIDIQPTQEIENLARELGSLHDVLWRNGWADDQTLALLATFRAPSGGRPPAEGAVVPEPSEPAADQAATGQVFTQLAAEHRLQIAGYLGEAADFAHFGTVDRTTYLALKGSPEQAAVERRRGHALLAEAAQDQSHNLPAIFRKVSAFIARPDPLHTTTHVAMAEALMESARVDNPTWLGGLDADALKQMVVEVSRISRGLQTAGLGNPALFDRLAGFVMQLGQQIAQRWDPEDDGKWPGPQAYAALWGRR